MAGDVSPVAMFLLPSLSHCHHLADRNDDLGAAAASRWRPRRREGGLKVSSFGNLREDNDFADVTLACGDDHRVEAHRVILDEQVLFNRLLHSRHHININNVNVIVE